ncbi:oligosaccharide flippase family protein [Niallia taxi]|uniref:oligosaccharide flippase family protein n=1 Tax=Niallia taxi TaxID=2499688 RepID=UPI00300AD9C8
MNNFVKKLVGFSMGPVIGAFIAFITVPLTTYFVDASEYGKASMFSLFQLVIVTFLYLGIDQSYTREYYSEKNKLNLLQNSILVPLSLAVLLFLIILIFPEKISFILFESNDYKVASILFGIMIISLVFERFILLSIRMEEKALEYSLLNIFVKLAVLILTLIFVLLIRRDFLAVVYSAALGQIIGDIYLVVRYRKLFNLKNFSLDKRLLRKMMVFGFPIVIATSFSSVLNSFDRLSLRTWSTFYEIGIFAATLKIAGTFNIIQASFTSFWVPTAYRWYDEGKDIKYFKIVSDAILLTVSVLFFAVLFFKSFIINILSNGYEEAVYILAFLCLQPILYTLSETTCLGITFSRKSYLHIWVSIFSLVPNIIINIILVPKYGALGAAIATAVAYIFFFVFRTYFSSRNGMKFKVTKHYIVVLLMLLAAFANSISITGILMINIVLLAASLFLQYSTIKQMINMINKSNKFNFKKRIKYEKNL